MKALIIGVGNIGMRHIQGLSKLKDDQKHIYLFDLNKTYRLRFENELSKLQDKLNYFFVQNIQEVKNINFDLVIISTTANNRGKILNSILNELKFEFIVIEKPICNSLDDLEILKKISNKKIFVNFPHRYCDWNLKIKKKIKEYFFNQKLEVFITGSNLNIACNISHFIDLVNMWTGSLPISVHHSDLNKWVKSKRDGFFELDGCISITFQNDHKLTIIQDQKYENQIIKIQSEQKENCCLINYLEGFAKFGKSEKLLGNIKYQSDSTDILYKKLNSLNHEVTNLKLSVECYSMVLKRLIEFWNQKKNTNENKIIIT
ncbi:Gfo/Idh/MocA family oxidoreductase [Candidatus Pelagibacter sp.]|nr:Gfo/Idh/MocA family oxidoreductase [Candidatus Pelagibacter sp.]